MCSPFRGRIDHMFLCHGDEQYDCENLATTEVPDYDGAFRINVRASFHLISMAVPFMKINKNSKSDKGSSITVLTAVEGSKPNPF